MILLLKNDTTLDKTTRVKDKGILDAYNVLEFYISDKMLQDINYCRELVLQLLNTYISIGTSSVLVFNNMETILKEENEDTMQIDMIIGLLSGLHENGHRIVTTINPKSSAAEKLHIANTEHKTTIMDIMSDIESNGLGEGNWDLALNSYSDTEIISYFE